MAEKVKDKLSTKSENPARGQWSRQIELTLSCVGYTVGFGNLWRFPYVCMVNGGGAFLIPYIFFVFVCGFPLYFLELVLGQFASRNCVSIWKICPFFKGVGWTSFLCTIVFAIYCNVLLTWVLYYLGSSFATDVPWKTCENIWNSPACVDTLGDSSNVTATVESYLANGTQYLLNNTIQNEHIAASEEFWMYKVLDISEGIDHIGYIKWDRFLCLLFSWTLVFLCVIKGIRSFGKVVYVTSTVPYLFLTILFIRSITLPGSWEGIKYFTIPDWSKLTEFKVWRNSFLQVFFSLGPGWGCITSMSSYSRFENNCIRDAIIVCTTCCFTSLFAGIVTFSIMGFMANESGLTLNEVTRDGPGLVFVAYPEAVAQLPVSPVWAICFFLLLMLVGLSTQLTNIETICSVIQDEFLPALRKRKILLRAIVCCSMFIAGLIFTSQAGMYVLQVVDWYSYIFAIPLVVFLECVTICYIYGIGRFYRDISWMMKRKLSIFWFGCWGGIIPVVLVVSMVLAVMEMAPPTYGDYQYPSWIILVGWVLALMPMFTIPALCIDSFLSVKGSFLQRLQKCLRPDRDWGPSGDRELLEEYQNTVRHLRTWRQRLALRGATDTTSLGSDDVENNDTLTEKLALTSPVYNGDKI